MRRILPVLIVVTWGLWIGGMIVLFMAVSSLFQTFADRHDLAGLAASRLFRNFNIYRLPLAATLLLASVLHKTESRFKSSFLGLLAVATAAALVISMRLTPLIEKMRLAEMTQSPEFAKLHGISMGMYSMETLLLLLAGLLLPAFIARAK